MRLGADGDGALLQRALEGEPLDDPDVTALLVVARGVGALEQRGLAARTDFVADLRLRLMDESAGAGRPAEQPRPTVVRLGSRARVLVAAAAALLVLAGGLGALSRSALPGDRLYPVKQLLDRVVLELHRDSVGLGLTHLAQAREHVTDAEALLDRAQSEPVSQPAITPDAELDNDLTTAFAAATESSRRGRAVLLDAYRAEQRGDALTSLADFYAETLPVVDALSATPLPPAATAAWQRLHDELEQGRDETLRELAACSTCGDAAAQARALLARETTTPGPSSDAGTAGSAADTSLRGKPSPRSTAPSGTAGSSDSPDSGTTSTPDGAVRLPSVGVSSTGVAAGGGGITLPDPLPTVSLPGAGVNTSGATVGGGGVTLPGATVSVPTLTVPLPAPQP